MVFSNDCLVNKTQRDSIYNILNNKKAANPNVGQDCEFIYIFALKKKKNQFYLSLEETPVDFSKTSNKHVGINVCTCVSCSWDSVEEKSLLDFMFLPSATLRRVFTLSSSD